MAERFGIHEMEYGFRAIPKEEFTRLEQFAERMDPDYRRCGLDRYIRLRCDTANNAIGLAAYLTPTRLADSAFPEVTGTPPFVSNPQQNPLYLSQGYLKPAPQGVDAAAIWALPGGDGEGQTIADLENGWNLQHPELLSKKLNVSYGVSYNNFDHGNATLGVLVAPNDLLGIVGLCPSATDVRLISTFQPTDPQNSPEYDLFMALGAAVLDLHAGAVWLIEQQFLAFPVELLDYHYELIKLATTLGIVVVEPSGNSSTQGFRDLDDGFVVNFAGVPWFFLDENGLYVPNQVSTIPGVLAPGHPNFRDSGAILVAASTSAVPHNQWQNTCYGKRIDCYAWGENVMTLGSTDFGVYADTSAASAIIGGVASSVMAAVKTTFGYAMSPKQVRALLKVKGTPSAFPSEDKIGVMPNLKSIVSTITSHWQ